MLDDFWDCACGGDWRVSYSSSSRESETNGCRFGGAADDHCGAVHLQNTVGKISNPAQNGFHTDLCHIYSFLAVSARCRSGTGASVWNVDMGRDAGYAACGYSAAAGSADVDWQNRSTDKDNIFVHCIR